MTPFESLEARRLCSFGSVIKGYGTGGASSAPTIGGTDSSHVEAVTLGGGKTLVGVGGGLTRFNTDGTLDTTFGTNGITGFRGTNFVDAVADSTGRIYVLSTGTSGTLVQRYSASGRIDSTYGTGGAALVTSDGFFYPAAIDVQADGKVVVAGSGNAANGYTTRVYRLTTGAALDTGFASDGSADFKLGIDDLVTPYTSDSVVDMRVLGNGKIEVLGSSYNAATSYDSGNSFAALARLNSTGALDTSFALGGVARRGTFDGENLDASVGIIRADGSAVVATSEAHYDQTQRTSFVGFSGSGKTAFNSYTTLPSAVGLNDVTALADGRVAFVNLYGSTFTVSAAGAIGNVVTPVAKNGSGTDAIVATTDGDLILADVNSPYVRVTKVDAGRATDARPDNLPNAAAIDTAVDSEGGLHVVYYDTASQNLKYAYRNAQGYWGGIRTVDATVGAGAALSIDTFTGKKGVNVAIAYYASGSADLRLASSSTLGKKFAIETVTSKGSVGLSPSFHYTDNGGYAITYYNRTKKSLYYALNTGDGFSTELIDKGGEYSEFEFDPDTRRPAVTYTKSDNTVWYAFKGKGSTWADARTKVATTSSGAAFVNLAIPNSVAYSGGPKISYYDLAGADLVLATYDRDAAAGKRWGTQIVAGRGVVGGYSDLSGNGYDATLFAYSKSGDSAFQYAFDRYGGTATATPIATGGGKFLSVVTDASGTPLAIAYQDTATGLTFVR